MEDTLVRRTSVLGRCGFSSATLYRLLKVQSFPRPVRLRCGGKAWRSSDVSRWIAEQKVDGDNGETTTGVSQ